MKKFLLVLSACLMICPPVFATPTDNIALLAKKGFFDKPQESCFSNPFEDVKKVVELQFKYSNLNDFEKLKSLYSDKYISADGFSRDIYFDLVKKTWEAYPGIKYKANINNIQINDSTAVVDVTEAAYANTKSESGIVNQKGTLESLSDSVYYLEKINNEWLVTSDHIVYEKTLLRYGSAKDINVNLVAPNQVPAETPYTASLKIDTPKDSIIIASVGQEYITYPQATAEEVFRKMPMDGVLERVLKSNNKNISEYAVASYGITKAELKNGTDLRIHISGLGFAMTRVNVIPKNNYIKPVSDDKDTKGKDEKTK